MEKPRFIFVHGLSGWGSYDQAYRKMPYWGMRTGDLMQFLQKQGFDCYAASVAPTGSAWDRACELYAQLTGTRTDYGTVHAARCRHDRFGKDFSSCPLIPSWNETTRLVLLGHSFGGATVRLFSHLLTYGDADERNGTDPGDLSPFFSGKAEARVKAVVTIASPMNGTTAYDLFTDPAFDPGKVRTPWWSGVLSDMMALGTRPRRDQRSGADYADHDMRIDNALALNEKLSIQPDIYYFSVPCSSTVRQPDGSYAPDRKITEPLFVERSLQMGCFTGTTAKGFSIGPEWRENDGLVNTLSASYPLNDPHTPLNEGKIESGIWNVYPVYRGDHMALQGGLTKKHGIREFYRDMLNLISSIAEEKNGNGQDIADSM